MILLSDHGLPTHPPKPTRPLRILLVEDNRDAADCLQLLLELYGHQVAVAYTGSEGVQAAAQLRPDVVLCDIGLPGLDGYEVARALRRHPATRNSRLIAITAYSGDEFRHLSKDAGFDQHLIKPVDLGVLEEALRHTSSEGDPMGPDHVGSFAALP